MMTTNPSGVEVKVLRWLKKYHRDNYVFVRDFIYDAISIFHKYGFFTTDITFEGVPSQVNSVNFEKNFTDRTGYIEIIFDKGGALRFQISFGVKETKAPHRWIRAASLSKRKIEDVSVKWWGASWISFSKKEAFRKDWEKFQKSVNDILLFIDEGTEKGFVVSRSIGNCV